MAPHHPAKPKSDCVRGDAPGVGHPGWVQLRHAGDSRRTGENGARVDGEGAYGREKKVGKSQRSANGRVLTRGISGSSERKTTQKAGRRD